MSLTIMEIVYYDSYCLIKKGGEKVMYIYFLNYIFRSIFIIKYCKN